MKPVPLVLLLASVLLTSVCRPRNLQLDEVLLRAAGDNAVSYLLRLLQRNPRFTSPNNALSLEEVATAAQMDTGVISLLLELHPGAEGDPHDEDRLEELVHPSKRSDNRPISIDLTFHLLRNMIEMAKMENQREQAELNRKLLDEVGK